MTRQATRSACILGCVLTMRRGSGGRELRTSSNQPQWPEAHRSHSAPHLAPCRLLRARVAASWLAVGAGARGGAAPAGGLAEAAGLNPSIGTLQVGRAGVLEGLVRTPLGCHAR